MTSAPDDDLQYTFADAERAHLETWIALDTREKIAFFEEMVELAYHSGALTPERLALRGE